METTSLILRESVPTREQQRDIAKEISRQIVDGDIDVMRIKILMNAWKNIFESIEKNEQVKKAVLAEGSKYNKQAYMGADIEIGNKTNYKYDHDPKWFALNKEIKEREELLKKIPVDKPLADTDTGELIESAFNGSTEYVKITFKKQEQPKGII